MEIKCPTTDLTAYPHLNDNGKQYNGRPLLRANARPNDGYWHQTILFFVFYEEHKGHLEPLEYDETFDNLLCNNLRKFFHLYMAPQLTKGRKRKM